MQFQPTETWAQSSRGASTDGVACAVAAPLHLGPITLYVAGLVFNASDLGAP